LGQRGEPGVLLLGSELSPGKLEAERSQLLFGLHPAGSFFV
jgi:hypothetical protein